jgi:hypothetical protein
MVKIKMDIFVKKYQPEKYELWLRGMENTLHTNHTTKQRKLSHNAISNDDEDDNSGSENNQTGYVPKKRFQISQNPYSQSKRKRFNSTSTAFSDYFNKLSLVNSQALIANTNPNDNLLSNSIKSTIEGYKLPITIDSCLTHSLMATDRFSLKYQCAASCLLLFHSVNGDHDDGSVHSDFKYCNSVDDLASLKCKKSWFFILFFLRFNSEKLLAASRIEECFVEMKFYSKLLE